MARHTHQVRVLPRFIRPGQSAPRQPESAGIMAYPEIRIQHNPVHAVVAAPQQVRIPIAQRVRHISHAKLTLWSSANSGFWLPRLLTSAAPQGPLFRGAVREKAYDVNVESSKMATRLRRA